ncbi:PucR family transcriptional regulator, partial [Streptomyces varsoviensis]
GAAARIGALLAAEARAGRELGELLRELLTSAPAGRDAARDALRGALPEAAGGPLALVAVTPWDREDLDAAPLPSLPGLLAACAVPEAADRPDGGAGRGGAEQDAAAGLAALVRLRSPAALDPARAVAEQLLRSPRAHGSGAGVSDPRRGLADAPAAWREALAAARAARAEARFGPVAEWGGVGPYRVLAGLPAGGAADRVVRPLLERSHTELARTAEVFLDCAGQAGRTAAQLGIHRQTLYYRLSKVEQLTGLDLDEGEDRLLLHMSLKAARL